LINAEEVCRSAREITADAIAVRVRAAKILAEAVELRRKSQHARSRRGETRGLEERGERG
jgi:hypothetical protein